MPTMRARSPQAVSTLRMYLDVDRDGAVDHIPADYGDWQWGVAEENRGAIIMVNTRQYDEEENVNARTEIRFKWDNNSREPADRDWQARLTVTESDNVKISLGQRSNAGELIIALDDVINLKDDEIAELYDVNTGEFSLWIEARDFPASEDEDAWRVRLTYRFTAVNGDVTEQDAQLRIAPWIMSCDLDPTRYLFVLNFSSRVKNGQIKTSNATLQASLSGWAGDSFQALGVLSERRYLRDKMRFGTISGSYGDDGVCEAVVLRGNQRPVLSSGQRTFRDLLDLKERGIGYLERGALGDSNFNTGGNLVVSPPVDDWPCGRIIYGGVDRQGDTFCAEWRNFFVQQKVQRPIAIDTRWLSVGHADEIISFVPVPNGDAGDFRLLIASPRRAYRILRGINLDTVAEVRTNQPLPANATWISWEQISNRAGQVGPPNDWPNQVDFTANEVAAQGENADREVNLNYGNGRIFFNRFDNHGHLQQRWIDDFLREDRLIQHGNNHLTNNLIRERLDTVLNIMDNTVPDQPFENVDEDIYNSMAYLTEVKDRIAIADLDLQDCYYHSQLFHNLCIQVKLNRIRTQVKEELGIDDGDIIEVPVLYMRGDASASAKTDVADMINFVYLDNNISIIPEPYGPIMDRDDLFRNALRTDLEGLGLTVHFINEWHEYKLDEGEIHCGTNQCPEAESKRWWESEPPDE